MGNQEKALIFVLGVTFGVILHLLKFNFVSQTWDRGTMYPSMSECVSNESAMCQSKIAEVYFRK